MLNTVPYNIFQVQLSFDCYGIKFADNVTDKYFPGYSIACVAYLLQFYGV